MKNIAIIPARAGSKRIPNKNCKSFLGKPIIAYSIEVAKKVGIFDEVMVATDGNDISKIATRYGARVPFRRSPENANHTAPLANVVLETIRQYEQEGTYFDNLCCLLATAPFITCDLIKKAYKILLNESCDCVLTIQRFSYPIQRALEYNQNGFLKMICPENQKKRSQDFKPAYHDAGQFYFSKVASFKKNRMFFAGKMKGIDLLEHQAHDIDTPEDWQVAELKYKVVHGS